MTNFDTRHQVAKSIKVFKTIKKKKIGPQTKKIMPKWYICLLVNGCVAMFNLQKLSLWLNSSGETLAVKVKTSFS